MVKDDNFINIQGWMVNRLGLNGNELICYALIYGFCQDGRSVFSGGLKYISGWLNISERSTIDVLKRLTEKGYIEKKNCEAGKVNGYVCCPVDKSVNNPVDKCCTGGEESSGVGVKKVQG
ncbi:MAG: winged helix DNA-binding protein [Methanobrevibacter sp.]|nr:winged helix DNA-binding protein [Methanobrevibacter sp.]